MATFRIGDRARIVGNKSAWLDFYGKSVTVISELTEARSMGRAYVGHAIAVDGHVGLGWTYVAETHELEPLQPDRNRVVAWETVPGGHPEFREVSA
jgi:hypothetical protein